MLSHVLNGLSYGSLLFLVASGLTLSFGLMRALNLAHGAFYVLGGYLSLYVLERTDNYWLSALAAVAVVGLVGVVFERALLHRILDQELPQVVLTIGVAFIIGDLILAFFGGRPQNPPRPPGLGGVIEIAGTPFPLFRLALIGVALALWAGLFHLMQRTRVGAMIRAAVDDEPIARSVGIPVPLIFMTVFGVGAGLAAFAGVWGGAFTGLSPGSDFTILLLAIVVVVVGGLGSVTGALVAALGIGLLDEFGKVLFPDLALFTIYAPVAVLLAFRPEGLFGSVERR